MLLKTCQVAEILGLNVQTVRRLCREKKIQCTEVQGGETNSPNGRRYRIEEENVLAFLKERASGEDPCDARPLLRGKSPPGAALLLPQLVQSTALGLA